MFTRICLLLLLLAPLPLHAHDVWVQTNTNLIRLGDSVHIDLMLGNHGNHHRDFRLAGKINTEGSQLNLHAPNGKKYDLKSDLIDTGYTPKEGFWSARAIAAAPGLHTVEYKADQVVNHGQPVRSVRSAKTFFVVSPLLDKVDPNMPGFDKPLGHELEIIPTSHPILPMGPGEEIKVQLLFKGKPLADTPVSFIPRSQTLKEGFDEKYERKTDAQGKAKFTPKFGDYYLIVAHQQAPDEKSDKYTRTQYTATLNLFVPELCPCCE